MLRQPVGVAPSQRAMDTTAGMVMKATNQGVTWEEFFTSKQTAGKPMEVFSVLHIGGHCVGLGALP